MKNSILNIFMLLMFIACVSDQELEIIPIDQEMPEALVIDQVTGLKLENYIVFEEVRINAKLPIDGYYRIKIKHGLFVANLEAIFSPAEPAVIEQTLEESKAITDTIVITKTIKPTIVKPVKKKTETEKRKEEGLDW